MKKICLILALAGCLLIVGCGKKSEPVEEPSSAPVVQEEVAQEAPSQEAPKASEAKASKEASKEVEVQKDAPAQEAEKAAKEEAAPSAPTTGEAAVTAENAPKVFWAMDIVYHLEGCKATSGQEVQEVPWDVVKEIGLRQCPECNPPQYEGYVAAE